MRTNNYISTTHLASQLARGAHDKEAGRPSALGSARIVVIGETRKVLDHGQPEGDGLSGSGARLSADVAPGEDVVVSDGLCKSEKERTTDRALRCRALR